MTFSEEIEGVKVVSGKSPEELMKLLKEQAKITTSSVTGAVGLWRLLGLACRALHVARSLDGTQKNLSACENIAAIISRQGSTPPAYVPFPAHLEERVRNLETIDNMLVDEWRDLARDLALFAEFAQLERAKRRRFCRSSLLRRGQRVRLRRS